MRNKFLHFLPTLYPYFQIKNVIPGGPAHRDGVLQMGDVLVYVNNECVLGASQTHACLIFQSIGVGDLVTLQICRGYPLLFDPANKVFFPFSSSLSLSLSLSLFSPFYINLMTLTITAEKFSF